MILGLRTAIYHTPDLARGKEFYARILGFAPYFDEPFYVGFAVGGFELGLLPDGPPGPGGSEAYWGVAEIASAAAKLAELGAIPQGAIQDVGGGIQVARFADPFGNIFAVIENPHFDANAVR